ncbi:hypothetical protein H6G41_24490 [Tolypothrix sp. FACHB-123]|nr:hypothetical protein [Tolypothrix sp. FACHB-123]MBD2357731.1 hypothetical protein [Tolypothrix sp. FACHB-123]
MTTGKGFQLRNSRFGYDNCYLGDRLLSFTEILQYCDRSVYNHKLKSLV